MRTRGDLAENHVVALDEHFDAEYAEAAEGVGYFLRVFLGALEGLFAHRVRLPASAVVAVNLLVADGGAEGCAAAVANG